MSFDKRGSGRQYALFEVSRIELESSAIGSNSLVDEN